ncbi:uncharacterized protein LOC118205009 [Stegodyphus dumicola]|uniref:uncharacterized protein LOC118205009 n=1 Tax=Stegodyphus dumicola TaxID=202533 RepID=UPI0015A897E5|nr:uncharacterized protein LOC118205009 [Stegodyphus dumicola]
MESELLSHTDYEKHKPVLLGHPADIDLSDSIQLVYASSKKNSFSLYTDGSKTERGAGSAFCALQGETIIKTWKRRLDIRNTVFQTEVAALKAAIKFAVYSLRFLDSEQQSSVTRPLAWQRLEEIKAGALMYKSSKKFFCIAPPSLRPHLVWVPAHVGITGNEKADELAKSAANDKSLREYPVKLPTSYLKRSTLENLLCQWQERWDSAPTGRSL